MHSDLKLKTKRALVWSFLEAVGLRGVQFVIGVILARLLLPEQFGLIGMLAIFMAISQSLLSSGFGSALIQKKEVTREDTSSVFYFNVAISILLASLLCLAAPWVSAFYKEPVLTRLTQAMSMVIVINSFALIQTTMLTRNMNFKIQTKVSLIASIGSGGIGVVMAYRGFGVWSLVGQQISLALFRAGLLWILNTWRPGLIFSIQSLRQMFKFGSRVLVSGVLNQIFENIYHVVIGRFFNSTILGFYTRAKRMQDLPSLTLSTIVSRVTFPVFSSIQDDNVRLKRAFRKALALLVLINAPIMIGLAAVAKPLVLILLTEKWLPCVPYLQLLCVLGLLFPVHILNLNLLMAKGRSDLFLHLEIIKKVLVVLTILIVWRWGVIALICGQIAVSFIAFFLNTYYTGKLLGYNAMEQIRDIAVYYILAVIMGTGIYLLGVLPFTNDLLQLFAQVFAGAAVFLVLCILFRPSAFIEGWHEICQKFPAIKQSTIKIKQKVLGRSFYVL